MNNKVTMKHISNLSGYSISTVSKAINERKDISEQTRSKILKLASSYNYRPNNSAVALKCKKTKIIAVILPKVTSIIYSSILSGIQENAFSKGYKVIILQSFTSEKKELECINEIKDGSVDGLILVKSSNNNNNLSNIMFPFNLVYVNSKLSSDRNTWNLKGKKSFGTLFQKIF